MNLYLVTFYNEGKKVCNTLQRAKDEIEAMEKSGFRLMCKYSNVAFDEQKTELIEEE